MNEKQNIETCTTAAKSAFRNSAVERHNLIVAEAMEKTLEGEKCEPELVRAWDITAKSALQNHLGHNLNEIVFGLNINTTSVLTDQLPAVEAATTSEMGRTNFNTVHVAKEKLH